jgi:hypothetical protein
MSTLERFSCKDFSKEDICLLKDPMSLEELKSRLSYYLRSNVDLILKDNRSTFLHITENKKSCIKLLIHRLFLFGPEKICESLARYVINNEKKSLITLKKFAQRYFLQKDYSNTLNKKKLFFEGKFYDLKKIYERLNLRYFQNKADLHITWFLQPSYKNWTHFTLGSYTDSIKLIRINQLLDDPFIPPYFLSYIIYHEIMHAIIPVTINDNGKRNVHSKIFKEKEKEFLYYKNAINWEKEYLSQFLRRKKKEVIYGRS